MNNILSRKNFMSVKDINESFKSEDQLILGKIDYTLLKPEATEQNILDLCEKADKLGVKSVCVLPKMVSTAANALKDSKVLVCTVVSFPRGIDRKYSKLEECRRAIMDGADEVDMVLNYSRLKQAETEYDEVVQELIEEIYLLVDECHKRTNKDSDPVILKVIVESGLLKSEETELATKICVEAGADFIKTSTGMVEIGAELSKVQIMRNIITSFSDTMKIKASGGIRTMEDIKKFEPFVDRFGIGFTAVDKIFTGENKGEENY